MNPMNPSDQSTRVEQAAHNNAVWCDTVCRTHGVPGEFQSQIWLNHGPAPVYYPNAVTLSDTADTIDQVAAVQRLNATPANPVSVKDSFYRLDLSPLGFQVLFKATWLWCDPVAANQSVPSDGIHWITIKTPNLLAQWESAWAGIPANSDATPNTRMFLPALLNDPDVQFLAAFHNDLMVAGGIINKTGDVVGLSNQFVTGEKFNAYWANCLAFIATIYPGLPIVGYEHGAALELAKSIGFEQIGMLRVWLSGRK